MEPAPMESTAINLPSGESKPRAGNKGCTIDAAVIMATVYDPCAVFKTKVTRNGKKRPSDSKAVLLPR